MEKISKCNLEGCDEKLGGVNKFKCHYCGGFFCGEHRLPEEHNCKGNPINPHKIK